MMATVIYHPADSPLAQRIQADLARLNGDDRTVIVVLSPAAVADSKIQAAIMEAIERRQRVIPVLAQAVPLPRLIEHLESLDFSNGYDFGQLVARLTAEPDAMQMKVLTPQTIAANRRAGFVVAIAAVFMFLAALYGVGVLGIQAPVEEYASVETEIVETRNAYIDAALPHSTEDAANFPATVDAAATALRPFLVATATAVVGE